MAWGLGSVLWMGPVLLHSNVCGQVGGDLGGKDVGCGGERGCRCGGVGME